MNEGMVNGVLFPTETAFIIRFNPVFEKFSLCNYGSMNKLLLKFS